MCALATELCGADCDGDRTVAVAELVICVGIASGATELRACPGCDAGGDGAVGIDDLVGAVDDAVHGCALPPTPTPTPGPPMPPEATAPVRAMPGCGAPGLKPCVQRAPAGQGPQPCAATLLTSPGDVPGTTVGGTNMLGGVNCGTKGGGTGAPERVFEFVAPVSGLYDIAVQGEGVPRFAPVVSVRRQSCHGAYVACAVDASVASRPELSVAMGPEERIAIVVDGNGANRQGAFTLSIRQRQPDLQVDALTAPPVANAGEAVVVSARVSNRGTIAAGPFRVEFTYARDGTLGQRLGATVACQVGGLAPGETIECAPATPLRVPRVAAGQYVVGAIAVLSVGADRDDDNNVRVRPAAIRVVGARLEQQLFRAADGTAYQLLRVVPIDEPSAAEQWRIVGVTGGGSFDCDGLPAEVQASASSATQSVFLGFEIQYQIEMRGTGCVAAPRRSAILRPNDLAELTFQPDGSGRLLLGSGTGAMQVCQSEAQCAPGVGGDLGSVFAAGGGMPRGCSIFFDGAVRDALGFGLSASIHNDCEGKPTSSAMACAPAPVDGFTLLPGEAVAFVYAAGTEAFSVAAVGFGINGDESDGCTAGQIVDVAALTSDSSASPLLSFVAHIADGEIGLRGAAASADGVNLYVAGAAAGTLLVYRRAPATGTLALTETQRTGVNGVGGLGGAAGVAVSPDDRHLYVTGALDHAVAIFSRDLSSGALTFVGQQRHGVAGVSGLVGARSVVVSPDGGYVHVAGRGRPFPFISPQVTLATFARDPATGGLQFLGSESYAITSRAAAPDADVSLAASPDGRHLYLASADLKRVLALFVRPDGSLLETQAVRGGGGIAVSDDGRNVYAVDTEGSTLTVFVRDAATGALTSLQDLSSAGARPLLSPQAVGITPDGTQVYVTSAGALFVFARDPDNGTLAPLGTLESPVVDGLARARALVFVRSANVQHGYVVSGTPDDAVAVLRHVDPAALPTAVAVDRPVSGRVDGLDGVRAVAVAPDGGAVYGAGPEGLAVFARDADTGRLGFVERLQSLGAVSGLVVGPDSRHVYASSASGLVTLSRNPSGTLSVIQTEAGLSGPLSLTPDGASLYVGAAGIVGRQRNASTGMLGAGAGLPNPGGTVTTLAATDAFVFFSFNSFNPTKAFMAVAGRNPQTGALALGDSYTNDDTVALGATSVVASSDARSAFLTTSRTPLTLPHGLRAFLRGGGGGFPVVLALTARLDADEAVSVLGARSIARSPDQRYLFVAASSQDPVRPVDSVAAFEQARRAGGDSGLSFVQVDVKRDDSGRIDGLGGAAGVAVTADGRHVYVAGSTDDAIAIFAVNRLGAAGASPTPSPTPSPTTPGSPSPTVPAPANDECANATEITAATQLTQNTRGATIGLAPLDPFSGCGNSSRRNSVWFRYAGDVPIVLDTRGSDYDTIISVYPSCGVLGPGADCNDDEDPRIRSSLATTALAPPYYVMVTSFAPGGGTLKLTASQGPTNDTCTGATFIGQDRIPFNSTRGTTFATTSPTDPAPACGNGSKARSVWFLLGLSAVPRQVQIDSSGYDTILAAYTGSCEALVPVPNACNDDAAKGVPGSRLQMGLAANTLYYLQVTSHDGTVGDLTLSVRALQ